MKRCHIDGNVVSTNACICLRNEVCFCTVCISAKCISSERILMIFSGKNTYMLGRNQLSFGEDLDSFVDPESFSKILYC